MNLGGSEDEELHAAAGLTPESRRCAWPTAGPCPPQASAGRQQKSQLLRGSEPLRAHSNLLCQSAAELMGNTHAHLHKHTQTLAITHKYTRRLVRVSS